MNYQDLTLQHSYISKGDHSIAESFINPVLRITKVYKRSVGFFSSGVLTSIINGVVSLVRNKGKVQLIASPQLSEEDIQAIKNGYEAREKVINSAFTRTFIDEINCFDEQQLNLLSELIARNVLDIKIAVTDSLGSYHDKLGVFEDFDGNKIVFYGSANSSINGYQENYEKVRVFRSWNVAESESVEDEVQEFESLWSGTNEFVHTYSYTQCAEENLFKVIEHKKSQKQRKNEPIVLRDYQEEAIQAWVENDYHGFYVMATGTGKTWTAIYSAKKLLEKTPAMIVICAPYKHLVKQWAEDVEKVFETCKIILVSSENPTWEQELTDAIIAKRYKPEKQIVVISTIASFKMDRFNNTISKSTEPKLLIVDEAHRFTQRPVELRDDYKYMLGLSATPFSGTSAQKGKQLMEFFGGQVFNLPIEEALDRGFLVPYDYHPVIVYATEDEEDEFKRISAKIPACFKNNICIDPTKLALLLRGRLRVISMATEKHNKLKQIVKQIGMKDHFVVYCGDGRLFDEKTGEEIRHIQSVKRVLSSLEYKSSQFTCQENMRDRIELVDSFNKGEISALAAIRCLDEGINIPSIKSALILSSNDDYREFVQRRGRILRLYKGKESAQIFDIVVLPAAYMDVWAKIELRRFYEYAKLARNWDELEVQLMRLLAKYGLSLDDIDVYDYEDVEDHFDE